VSCPEIDAVIGGIEKQFEGQPLGLAADKLLQRRVQSWNRNLGEMRAFVPGKLGRVVLQIDLFGILHVRRRLKPVDEQRRLGYLFHRRLLPLFKFMADAAGNPLFGTHPRGMHLLIAQRFEHGVHDLVHGLRR
jgi:hypothetical protein